MIPNESIFTTFFVAVAVSAIVAALCAKKMERYFQREQSGGQEQEQEVQMASSGTGQKTRYTPPPFASRGYLDMMQNIGGKNLPLNLVKLSREHGTTFQLHLPSFSGPMAFATSNFSVCKEILLDRNSIKSPSVYHSFQIVHDGGNDIFTSTDNMFWKHSRKSMSSAFSSRHIDRMSQVVIEQIEHLILNKLRDFARTGEAFDIDKEMTGLTLSIICKGAFDYVISEKEKLFVLSEMNIALEERRKRFYTPFRQKFSSLIPSARRGTRAGKNLVSFANNIIASYRSTNAANEPAIEGTVINKIMNNRNYNNDKERASDIIILIFAGFDTTAHSITWTLLELARHPKIQDQLRRSLLCCEENNIKNRPHSQFLDCVIKEGLRLHPVAAVASVRLTSKDIIIKGSTEKNGIQHEQKDMLIPKGSCALISPMLIFRNTEYYADPDRFDPNRWLDPPLKATDAFIPFSLGSRSCIGQNLGMAEIRNVLSRICVEFKVSVENEGVPEYLGTYKPSGCLLTIERLS